MSKKINRVVRNSVRKTRVLADERVRDRAQSATSGTLGTALVVGALSVTALPAEAANICTTASTTVSTAQPAADFCVLPANGTLLVDGTGTINPTSGNNLGVGYSAVRGAGTLGGITVLNGGRILLGTGPFNPGHGGSPSIDNGIDVPAGTNLIGGINNAGQIISYRHNGIGIWNTGIVTGDIVNASTGRLGAAHDTIELDFGGRLTGSVINHGVIHSQYWDAIAVGANSRIEGAIVNTGTIVVNTGTVGAWDNCGAGRCNVAINIWNNGADVVGGINNSGTIAGYNAGIGVYNAASVTGGITNTGVVRGQHRSIDLNNTVSVFEVHNYGTLDGAAIFGRNTLNLNGNTARVIGVMSGQGTVNVNGTFSSEGEVFAGRFNINDGARFNINHAVSVSGAGFHNTGVLALGGAARSITGTYHQAANGALALTLADATTGYGRLSVSGAATLAGATGINVNVVGSPGLSSGTVIQGVLVSGGALTATPASMVVSDNSLSYDFVASTARNARELDLVVQAAASPFTAAATASNPAARGVAGALESMIANGVPAAMQPTLLALDRLTPAEATQAMAQMLPAVMGVGPQAGLTALHSMNKIIQSRIEAHQGLSSGDDAAERYMWVRAFGARGDQDDRNGVDGYRSRTNGFVLGSDKPITARVRAGAAFTYARSHIEGNSTTAPSSTEVDTYEFVGYASQNLNPVTDVNYQLDLGHNRGRSARMAFGGTTASASFSSLALHGSVGIGRVLNLSASTNVTPSVRLDYTHMRTGGYTESGAGNLNLNVAASTYQEALVTLDAKAAYQSDAKWKLVGNVSAGYDRRFQGSSATLLI